MPTHERTLVGVRYMAGFSCIGPACEDTCCSLWTIIVDRSHYQQICDAMAGEPAGGHESHHAFELRPAAEREERFFASIRLRTDGRCPLLDDSGLCSLQLRGGEALLPHACAVYPRKLSRVGDQVELTGALSCPEVARRALLREDALDIIPFAETAVGRPLIFQVWGEHSDDEDARHLNLVRRAMTGYADRTELPLASRLFCMLALAIETEPLFDRQSGRLLDLAGLEAAIERLGQPEALAFLHQQISGGTASTQGAMQVLQSVLDVHLRSFRQSPLRKHIDTARAGYSDRADRTDRTDSADAAEPPSLLRAYLDCRDMVLASLPAPLAARLDLYFRNYIKLFWTREWHVRAPGLRVHVQDLLVRVALLRFLLLSHPATAAAAAAAAAPSSTADATANTIAATDPRSLDAIAVDVFSSFSRAVEHDRQFLGGLGRTLARDILPPADWIGLLRM